MYDNVHNVHNGERTSRGCGRTHPGDAHGDFNQNNVLVAAEDISGAVVGLAVAFKRMRKDLPLAVGALIGSDLTRRLSFVPPLLTADRNPTCPQSPVYDVLLGTAVASMFESKKLGDINSLAHKFDCDIHSPEDAVAKVNEVLGTAGDHYNAAISAEQVKIEQEERKGEVGSVGLTLEDPGTTRGGRSTAKFPVVAEVDDDGPAKNAGVRKGDVVMAIDGKSTAGMSASDAEDLLDGTIGSEVGIKFSRTGSQLELKLKREETAAAPSVQDPVDLGDGITYISIDDFIQQDTARQLREAIEHSPNARALLIDVRQNPGGDLQQAIAASELFIDSGRILSYTGRSPSDPANPLYASGEIKVNRFFTLGAVSNGWLPPIGGRYPNLVGKRPVVVLTDDRTASAAEIFAGALHDTAHATTVGVKTFGKGIGQTVFEPLVAGTGLHITSFHYHIPSGLWPGDAQANRFGIEPDVKVAIDSHWKPEQGLDNQVQTGIDILKKKLASQQQ